MEIETTENDTTENEIEMYGIKNTTYTRTDDLWFKVLNQGAANIR